MFSLKHTETQQVIKDWLEEHYKLGGLIPIKEISNEKAQLEEHYKLGGLIPYLPNSVSLESWKNITN
jgi:hypothetical protein